MMKLVLYIYLISISTHSFSQRFHTLPSAIQYAMDHNYDYKKAQLEKMITYEKTQEVLTQGFPKISGTLSYQNQFVVPTSIIPGEAFGRPGDLLPVQFGIANTMNASLGLQQLIFDGRYLVGVQARGAIKQLANTQVKMSERDVKLLVSKSYYQALISNKSLNTLRESKRVLDKLYEQTQKTYQQGLIEELDVERLQYNVKTLANTIDMLETQSALALSALKLNMGYPMEDTLVLADDTYSSIQKILITPVMNENVENRIELQMIEKSIAIRKYDVKQLRYSALPSLYGAFNYGYNSFSKSFNFFDNPWYNFGNFGLQLQVPIFDGLTRKSQVTQAKLALERAETERAQLFHALKLESMNSILTLRNTIEEYSNQSDIFKLSEKIERKTQVKYKEGVGSSFEFANAQNERIQQFLKLLQTELKLLNSNLDYLKASGKY